jgi:DNA-binding MarR family transcriptional regulator
VTQRTTAGPPAGGGPPAPSPAFLIMTMGRRLRAEIERDLTVHGLTLRHLSALGHLRREPGRSYSELARRADITVQSMQATLRQLEALGAVERRSPSGRGRTAELHLTDAGNRLLAAGLDTIAAADRRLLATLPDHDADTLGELLMRLFQAANGPER